MAALVQTIAVVDKSGKAISSSKHLVSVFKEAKAAYLERKAEIAASRQRSLQDHGQASRSLNAGREGHQSIHSSPSRSGHRHYDRRRSVDSTRSASTSRSSIDPASKNRHTHDPDSPTSPPSGLRRSYTADDDSHAVIPRKPVPVRSMTAPASASDIDMGLAYGELPPSSSLSRSPSPDQQELKPLVNKVKRLLEEAECLQHTASATMASLQKNPEAMAAVALALAEISNIARKMAPSALIALRNSAPAVFGLLASPQFLIAGGVAVGLTVVAFGGYKIVKRIKASESMERDNGVDEMLEIGGDVSRIETWRRGIAESEIQSDGTSVEGEFITPHAHAMSRLTLHEQERQSKPRRSHSKASSHGSSSSSKRSEGGSSKATSRKSEKGKSKEKKEKKEKEKKDKKPSPLRSMFH